MQTARIYCYVVGIKQYLTVKFRMGETLLQPLTKRIRNAEVLSLLWWKLCDSERRPKKKGLHRKPKSFWARNQVKKKKGLHRNFGLVSTGIYGICLCWQALFRLFTHRSNLDEETLNLDGGDANSLWGDANSLWGDAFLLQFKYWY